MELRVHRSRESLQKLTFIAEFTQYFESLARREHHRLCNERSHFGMSLEINKINKRIEAASTRNRKAIDAEFNKTERDVNPY